MTEHVQDAKAVFLAALEKATQAERDAFVEAACAGNEELLRRVRELLAFHDATRGPLDSPPPGVGVTMEPTTRELPGTMIGPYKLLQQIGEGGMGIVFMAEQVKPVHRRVALKIIKPGMDNRQVIARFEAERQALAMMDHVNIARVIDGGTVGVPALAGSSSLDPPDRLKPELQQGLGPPDRLKPELQQGRPFFVMELVNGVPITRYCDDHHLTPRERLELFIPVCQAIQHAHQKGIIHRDIKPSNVLVTLYDGKPVPKVIDFGVAKAMEQKLTEHTLFTNFGMMVGTLEYMSPEQAEVSGLGIDTRSDIYSLGVLLYELLTGSTPLTREQMKNAAYGELIRILKDVEPQKPSTRISSSGGELASISAQRKTEPAKLTKLVRGELDWIVMKTLEKDRNRRYETASAFAEDIQHYLKYEPVKACPPSTWYRLSKFGRRYKAAIITTAIVMLALIISTADSLYQMFEAKKARALADERLVNETEARNLALAAVRRMLTRVGDEIMPNVPQAEQIRLKLYQDAVEFYQQILLKRADDPELRYETAVALMRLGEMYMVLGHPEETVKQYNIAHSTLEELHKQSPDDPRFRVELARYFNRLDWQAYLDKADAVRNINRSIEFLQPIVDSHPPAFEIRGERVRSTLADTLRYKLSRIDLANETWNPDQIEQQVRKAMELCDDDSCPSLSVKANYYDLLATCESKRGNKAKAIEHCLLGVSASQKCLQKNPSSPIYRYHYGCHLRSCGDRYRDAGQLQEAASCLQKAVDWFEKLESDYPTSQTAKYQTIWVRMWPLAQVYLDLGQYEKTIEQVDKIEPVLCVVGRIEFRADGGSYVPGKPVSHMDGKHYQLRGIAHFHLKHYDKALADIAKAVEKNSGDPKNLSWFGTEELAKCTDESFKKGMLELGNKAIEMTEGKSGRAFAERGNLSVAMGKMDVALSSYTEALRLSPNDPGVLNNLAWLLATVADPQSRNPSRAVELAKKAVELRQNDGIVWNTLGTALYRAGDWKASVTALAKSLELMSSHKSFNWFFLAMAKWQLGNKEDARKYFDQAVQWMDKNMPQDEELIRFRAEATELLKIKEDIRTSK